MTNTIPNVPRELLELIVSKPLSVGMERDIRALLSAPSPAGVYSADPLACPGCASGCFRCASPGGVDGLKRYEVFPYLDDEVAELDICESDDGSFVKYEDAQAIIDGLRGEVERLQRAEKNDAIAYKAALERQGELRTERDQQARRIGELEQILRDLVPGCKWRIMRPRIDAALSAGKEGE